MLKVFSCFFATIGFAIMFNIPKNKIIPAGITGAIASLVYFLILNGGKSQTIALFFASITLSLVSEIFARILKCPATLFSICALIPFVPGGMMYYTMLDIVSNNFDSALVNGITTIIQACALVIGYVIISGLSHALKSIKRVY